MGLIQIDAGSHDLPELRVPIAAFRAACLVRRQIARDEERTKRRSASTQVVRRVDLLWQTLIWISISRVRRLRMTIVAAALSIHDVAAQADQIAILPFQVQMNRRDSETLRNS